MRSASKCVARNALALRCWKQVRINGTARLSSSIVKVNATKQPEERFHMSQAFPLAFAKNDQVLKFNTETRIHNSIAWLEHCGNLGKTFSTQNENNRLENTIKDIENCFKAKSPVCNNLVSELLDSLCRRSFFVTAMELLKVINRAKYARYRDYLRLANACVVSGDLSLAWEACEMSHTAGFPMDYFTSKALIYSLCERAMIAQNIVEANKYYAGTIHESKAYEENAILSLAFKDTRNAILHLLRMCETNAIPPDQHVFLPVLISLALQRQYHSAAHVLQVMRRQDVAKKEREEIENDDVADDVLTPEVTKKLSLVGAGIQANLGWYSAVQNAINESLNTKYPEDLEVENQVANIVDGEVQYISPAEDEMNFEETINPRKKKLVKEWSDPTWKGWGPYFILRELESDNSNSDSIHGPILEEVSIPHQDNNRSSEDSINKGLSIFMLLDQYCVEFGDSSPRNVYETSLGMSVQNDMYTGTNVEDHMMSVPHDEEALYESSDYDIGEDELEFENATGWSKNTSSAFYNFMNIWEKAALEDCESIFDLLEKDSNQP